MSISGRVAPFRYICDKWLAKAESSRGSGVAAVVEVAEKKSRARSWYNSRVFCVRTLRSWSTRDWGPGSVLASFKRRRDRSARFGVDFSISFGPGSVPFRDFSRFAGVSEAPEEPAIFALALVEGGSIPATRVAAPLLLMGPETVVADVWELVPLTRVREPGRCFFDRGR